MDCATCISAAVKHLDDAELLLGSGRFDNSAYLAGYVAECGLKALLLMPSMPGSKQLGHDLQLMAGDALHLAIALSPARRRYCMPDSPDFFDMIANWTSNERYTRRGTVGAVVATSRLRAAWEVHERVLVPHILDGQPMI